VEVELRELADGDAEELHALIERNREGLARWLRWARGQTPAETVAFVQRAKDKGRAGESVQRAVVVEGRIVGMASLPRIDVENHSAEIGYWLDEAHRGRGVMAAALAALVELAFGDLSLNRLEIHTDVENERSRALARRLGFRYEGVLREAYWVGDRYSDDAVYSLLAAERPALSVERPGG
jgi:RimJ/RimL family protein N-acetyltransferase